MKTQSFAVHAKVTRSTGLQTFTTEVIGDVPRGYCLTLRVTPSPDDAEKTFDDCASCTPDGFLLMNTISLSDTKDTV